MENLLSVKLKELPELVKVYYLLDTQIAAQKTINTVKTTKHCLERKFARAGIQLTIRGEPFPRTVQEVEASAGPGHPCDHSYQANSLATNVQSASYSIGG